MVSFRDSASRRSGEGSRRVQVVDAVYYCRREAYRRGRRYINGTERGRCNGVYFKMRHGARR